MLYKRVKKKFHHKASLMISMLRLLMSFTGLNSGKCQGSNQDSFYIPLAFMTGTISAGLKINSFTVAAEEIEN